MVALRGLAKTTPEPVAKDTETKMLKPKLLNAEELLAEMFTDQSRPSVRWLRARVADKSIPVIRVGHLTFFDADQVRCAWQNTRTIRARGPVQG